MAFGRIVHTEVGTSGTTYRVREVVGSPNILAITVGRGKAAFTVAEIPRSHLEDVSTYVDEADEETRCLIAEARAEFA